MWKRLLTYLKALFATETKMLDDPEHLLDDAQTKMLNTHALHRERAVQALTARDNLQKQCAEMRKRIEALTAKAIEAERSDDSEKAEKLLQECAKYEETLITMESQLARAMEMSEQVKVALEREEEKIRQKTREALELKAQWRNAQNERELERLNGLLEFKAQWRDALGDNDNYPQQTDPVIKWVLALIVLCLLGFLILRIIG